MKGGCVIFSCNESEMCGGLVLTFAGMVLLFLFTIFHV